MKNKTPYEGDEAAIMYLLKSTYELFIELDVIHPDEQEEFKKGIHECQNVIMRRITVRDYPDHFYNQQNKKIDPQHIDFDENKGC